MSLSRNIFIYVVLIVLKNVYMISNLNQLWIECSLCNLITHKMSVRLQAHAASCLNPYVDLNLGSFALPMINISIIPTSYFLSVSSIVHLNFRKSPER